MSERHDINKLLEHVTKRLVDRYRERGIDAPTVHEVVRVEADTFAGAKVIEFLPIFVERRAAARLDHLAASPQAS